ncbi:MAG: hypothetical protein IPN42_03915 [Methylococcaceae bacterium]|nr:hypothetical protein [Methylococcaceae bacterium]
MFIIQRVTILLFLFLSTYLPCEATTKLLTSVTKDGITWTFGQPVPVGQFVTGDYFVVGPVTVTSISPLPQNATPYKNGSVKNLPKSDGKSGFDQRLDDGVDESSHFNPAHRVYTPISLIPGDSLVSSVSLDTIHSLPELFGSQWDQPNNWSPVRSVSILTVLKSDVTPDAFRPSYCDRSQTVQYANNVQRNLLPSFTPPNSTIAAAMPTLLSQFEGAFRRPWIDLSRFLFDVPGEYMPSYSQHIAFADTYAALLLTLNYPASQKVNLTNYFVQYGIDLFGCVKAGVEYSAYGGHGSGRKLPIVTAGVLLNNTSMQNVSATYPNRFGEDMQTVYVNRIPGGYTQAWQGAKVIYGGHLGVRADGTIVDSKAFNGAAGPYEQLPPKNWAIWSGNQLGETYRRCCTSTVFVGEALAARLLRAQNAWNYPAFFDYADRWMTEDDTQDVANIKTLTGFNYSVGDSADFRRQRQTKNALIGRISHPTFIDDMWAAYRNASLNEIIAPPTNLIITP